MTVGFRLCLPYKALEHYMKTHHFIMQCKCFIQRGLVVGKIMQYTHLFTINSMKFVNI